MLMFLKGIIEAKGMILSNSPDKDGKHVVVKRHIPKGRYVVERGGE